MIHRISPRYLSCLFCSLILLSVYESQADDATHTKVSIPSNTLEEVDDDPEMQRLLMVLDKYTEIATKTRLNADFVPGMVTVLHGDDLAASGKRNVWEALAEVPGIEPFIESTGVQSLTMRGAGFTFSSGNVKLLVNGIPQNSNLQGEARPVMNLPVAQVERIEVIRGPGSAMHGEYAYTGVINVITRDKRQVFMRAGEDDSYSAGATLAWSAPDDTWQLSLNLFAEDMATGEVVSGPDSVDPAVTNAPGPVNDSRESHAAILELGYRDFGLDAQYIETRHGEQYGVNNTLPPPDDRLGYEHVNTAIEARQRFDLSRGWDTILRLGWQRHELTVDQIVVAINPLVGTARSDADYEEQQWYAGMQLEGTIGQRQELLFDLQYRETDIRTAKTGGGTFVPQGDFLEPEKDRHHLSLALQDQIRVRDDVTVTVGLRYDDYNDVGSSLSPRLAAVWRLADRQILKVQYAEAFRPPTFFELYTSSNPIIAGNPDIESTDSKNYELGYIFKGVDTTARATLFYTELEDLISVDSGTYANGGDARLRGLELELEHAVSKTLTTHANVSYTDTEDRDTGDDLTGAPDWMANLGVRYRLNPSVVLNAHYRYVTDRARGAGDTRSTLDDYQTLDLSANLLDTMLPGLTLRAGVRNLFDEDYAYPAPPNTYPDDYPQRGRQWWMQAEYKF